MWKEIKRQKQQQQIKEEKSRKKAKFSLDVLKTSEVVKENDIIFWLPHTYEYFCFHLCYFLVLFFNASSLRQNTF